MTGRAALRQGLQAARRGWRYAVWAWLLDLVVAAVAALPALAALDGAASRSADPAALAASFDERFFLELHASHPAIFGHWDLTLAVAAALAVLAHSFLAGGVIEVLGRRGATGEPAPLGARVFFTACVERAGRMIAVGVVAALLLALAGGLLHGVVGGRLEEALRDVGRERTRLLVGLAPGAAYLVLVAIVATWADVARAAAVLGEREALPALGVGARVLWRRKGALAVVGLGALVLQIAALLVFVGCDGAVPQGRWAGILLVVAAAQLLMLWRHGVRVAVIAATARLCGDALGVGAGAAQVADPDEPW